MSARVAIITRSKDRLPLLKRALHSVQVQTFTDWVQVIVNDGGDPEAIEALLETLDPAQREKTTVLHNEQSLGMQAAANEGIEASESTYLCIHDDDDEWEPTYLESVIRFLDDAGADSRYQGVITHAVEITECMESDGTFVELKRRPYIPLEEISLFRVGYENPFPPIAFCFRRSAWVALGGYDPRWDVIGDLDFNVRFLRRYEIGVIDEPLALYRIREDSSDLLGNSVLQKKDLHKRLFKEFKNEALRRVDDPEAAALAVSLNSAKYLVEAEWMLHSIYHGLERHEAELKRFSESVSIDGYSDRFSTVREALAILIDHARDPAVRDALGALVKSVGLDQREGAPSLRELLARTEALIDKSGSQVEASLQSMRKEVARLETVEELLRSAKTDRDALIGRLEELIASTGLSQYEGRFASLRDGLGQLLEVLQNDILSTLHGTIIETLHRSEHRAGELERWMREAAASAEAHRSDLGARIEGLREESMVRIEGLREEAMVREEQMAARLEAIEWQQAETVKAMGQQRLWRLGPFVFGLRRWTKKPPEAD
jgi:glycosyltransferase involved in cell wall biosynthesis